MESRRDETHLWTQNQNEIEAETLRRNQTGWTDSLEAGNMDEGVGTAIAGSSIVAVSIFTNIFVVAIITRKSV